MKDIRTTNILLLIIVIPVVFYILKILSFIFVPLIFSMFIALLFLPLMRWFSKRGIPKVFGIISVILIFAGIFKLGGSLVKLASQEILATKGAFIEKAEIKLVDLVLAIEKFLGIHRLDDQNILLHYFQKLNVMDNLGNTIDIIGNSLTMILMTVFFVILLLAESINFQVLLNQTVLKQKRTSVKAFIQTEKDILTFVKVKILVSALTGLGFGLACYFFGVSFPIFWGLFAFVINFVQMVGSFIAVILLAFFGFVELDFNTILLFFIITIIGVQVVCGSVLEPVFMGKSFSINILTILIMLMFWGYIWGISGLILSIPITVFIKIILEQFPRTQFIARLISGSKKKNTLIS